MGKTIEGDRLSLFPSKKWVLVLRLSGSNSFVALGDDRPAQSPRVGFVLFLDKKNQKSSHQEGFFTLQAYAHTSSLPLPCKPGRTTGC